MKKLLVGLLALGSICAFAQDITDFQLGYDKAISDIDKNEFWICSLNNQRFEYQAESNNGYVIDQVINQIEFLDISESGFSRAIALSKLKEKCDSPDTEFRIKERSKIKLNGYSDYSEYSEWHSANPFKREKLVDLKLRNGNLKRVACNELLVSQKAVCTKL